MSKRKGIEAAPRAKPRQARKPVDAAESTAADKQIVVALSRGLKLLNCFTPADVSLGNAELARRTGLSKSNVSRLAYTLALHNYLWFDPRLRDYRLGPRAISLGAVAFATTNVRTVALPLMRDLARGERFNVGLGTRDDLHMVYTDAAEGDSVVGLRLYPGSRLPLATSAMGRAYLATIDENERMDLFERMQARYQNGWPAIRRGVEQAIEMHERTGYCISVGEWQPDINGIAVPINSLPGMPLYVLNLGGPAYALPEAELRDRRAPELIRIARAVERILGTEQ